uniref:Uncharacterized protein n=1 Tax=Quercus lobata TaxID=97700 RepID=A0A7N2R1A0_QUELO
MTVDEAYIGEKTIDARGNTSELSPMLSSLLIEGIAQNTNGSVYVPEQSAIRRLQILEMQRFAVAVDADFDAPARSKNEYDNSNEENKCVVENGKAEEAKKVKPKKPKVSVSDAAAKIDADDLSAFLINILVSMSFSAWER